MAFHEVRFPDNIAYGATGGPEFKTSIVNLFSGFEQRNIDWSIARGQWDISTGIKKNSDMQAVIAFFRARFGMAHGFRFKDWSDYQATNQNLGTGTGAISVFQVKKLYTDAGGSYSRVIKKTVNNANFKVYLDSVLQGSGFTINHNTGEITFTSPVSNGVVVSADFEFDVPVRFAIDRLPVRIQSFEQFVADAIPLLEIRI